MKQRIISVTAVCAVLASLMSPAYAQPEENGEIRFDTVEESVEVIADGSSAETEEAVGTEDEIFFESDEEEAEDAGQLQEEAEEFTAGLAESSGSCGDKLSWELDNKGVLTISGIGDMWSFYSYYSPWYSMRSSIRSLNIKSGVTSISPLAFFECSSLSTVSLPDSLTSIGSEAFEYCSLLSSVTLPKNIRSIGKNAFSGCTGLNAVYISDLEKYLEINFENIASNPAKYAGNLYLKSKLITDLTIPKTVSRVSDYAFSGCKCIKRVTIPANIKTIGAGAFDDCAGLTRITIPKSVTEIDQNAFSDCTSLNTITMNEGLSRIGDGAFFGCTSLLNISIPKSVEEIDNDAFWACSSLKSIDIQGNVGSIGNNVFCSCSALKSITIPGSVKNIGINAFKKCTGLVDVKIENGVPGLPMGAFQGCSSLENITIPGSVTQIGDSAFFGCAQLEKIVIPEGVTDVGYGAFACCGGLKDITIPASLTHIDYCAFEECTSLERVNAADIKNWCGIVFGDMVANPLFYARDLYIDGVRATELSIPEGTEKINAMAFYGADCIRRVKIPADVTYIGEEAFGGCTSLTDITVADDDPEFSSLNGVLFNKDKTELIKYAAGRDSVSYTIPESVTSIGNYAFEGCGKLKTITMSERAERIGHNAFDGTAFFEDEGNWSGGILYAGNFLVGVKEDVSGNVVIRNGTKRIPNYAFERRSKLTGVVIPYGVESIGDLAFGYCEGLKSISIPGSVTDIGRMTFVGSGLTDVTIGSGTLTIDGSAFAGCGSLRRITIPDSVVSIGQGVFSGCGSITDIIVDRNNMNYCVENGVLFDKEKTELIKYTVSRSDSTYIVPDSVKRIDAYAFYMCRSLESITIPGTASIISNSAFAGCGGSLKRIYYGGSRLQWRIAYEKGRMNISDNYVACAADDSSPLSQIQADVSDEGDSYSFEVTVDNVYRNSRIYAEICDVSGRPLAVSEEEIPLTGKVNIKMPKRKDACSVRLYAWNDLHQPLAETVPLSLE